MRSRKFVALLLFVMVMGAGAAVYFAPSVHRVAAVAPVPGAPKVSSVSLPLFFEPNQGQTDPQVKFLARGSGYGIFLTAGEAVLKLQPSAPSPFGSGQAKNSHQPSGGGAQGAASSVIRMRLEGADAGAAVSGADLLPGKSSYFIGNDRSRWRRGIPQFARVEYKAVYPGIDLVYYGDQGQLEYDFRVAPAADPEQIALSFDGATARIDSGDLVLSTGRGDVRFRAPHIYQRNGEAEQAIAGGFRQLAQNKIGFSVGEYDRGRELVIDPVLSYSTYLGGSGVESSVRVAVGPDNNIYLAGSTMSSNFPTTANALHAHLLGAQNVFIAVINPTLPSAQQLLYATYLGSSGTDAPAGIAVSSNIDSGDSGYDVYVAGSTTSALGDFPTSSVIPPFQAGPKSGAHSFVARLNLGNNELRYSTYLAGNGSDTVTGLAIDSAGNAFVTGITTSTDPASNGFPANINGFQTVSYAANQFFASKVATKLPGGTQSMLYSTYFGGGNPPSGTVQGGGIAVDASGNMYITGGTNFLGVAGSGANQPAFPLYNAQQSCLDEASKTVCTLSNPTALDAFVAKINPNAPGQVPVFSTYLGGAGHDIGFGVAVDGSGNAYVTGSTTSGDWVVPTSVTPVQSANAGGQDAFIAKVANPGSGGSVYPLIYFTYLGGNGIDAGQAIVVDANQAAHVTGYTNSPNLPVTNFVTGPPPGNYSGATIGGATDAFVALVSTTTSATSTSSGNYVTYLGGSQADYGTGIALDVNNATYVSGNTLSTNFPNVNGLPPADSTGGTTQDAFVSKLGPSSTLQLTAATGSPSPSPVPVGTPAAFTFNIANTGPDAAVNVIFVANLPASGVTAQTAKVKSGSGSCTTVPPNTTVTCTIPTLAVQTSSTTGAAQIEVDVTPTTPVVSQQITVTGQLVSANGTSVSGQQIAQSVSVNDFSVSATPASQSVTAGQSTSFTVTLTPQPSYTATVSMTNAGLPTASTGTFTTSSVSMSGTTQATTTLNIATTARPVTTGSLFRGDALFATWLPVGGLSLLGLGVGASRKRRRWLAGTLLGLIVGIVLLQLGCGSSSSPATTTGGTPAGTYTITITGTSGSVSHNTTVRLVVN